MFTHAKQIKIITRRSQIVTWDGGVVQSADFQTSANNNNDHL